MEASKKASTSLLDLPSELRRQVFDLVIPVCRLAPFRLRDVEWYGSNTESRRGVPAFLFTSREIYEEVIPLIYSRAILEIAPTQQGNSFWNVQMGGGGGGGGGKTTSFAYSRLVSTFRPYRAEHLRLIRRAHVFSDQTTAVNAQCYEAMLLWLAERTGVQTIQLSSRLMTRISEQARFDLQSWKASFIDAVPRVSDNLRVIRIWTKRLRSHWEQDKIMRLRCWRLERTLNPIQIYFCISDEHSGNTELQLDPRWFTGLNEKPAGVAVLEAAAPMIDGIMHEILQGTEAQDYRDHAKHRDGDSWLYQMVLIPCRSGTTSSEQNVT